MKMRILLLLILLLFRMTLPAEETASESFIITLEGDAVYIDQDAQEFQAQAFATLSEGTKVVLKENSHLQLVYLSNGRQETWEGPVTFSTGAENSMAIESQVQPTVKDLPPFMMSVLMKSPEVISSIKTRQGMIRVRSLMTARKVKEAEENYKKMLSESSETDITPEIYLITTLDELRVYNKMLAPLETMIRKQPNNIQAKELYDQFKAVLENEKKRIE